MTRRRSILRYAALPCIMAAGVALSLLIAPPQKRFRVQWPVMGTVGAIVFKGGDAAENDALRAKTREIWDMLDERLSAWRDDSELALLSGRIAAEGEKALADVPPDVRPCYSFAFDLKRQSGGAFDPVIGEAMRNAGFTRLAQIDLGAVAKGFALDRAWEAIDGTARGGELMLDLGGDLRACGGTWRTGVRNPFKEGAFAASFDLAGGEAVATSGNYERFVERDGIRYSHIIDARTGESVTGVAGVTVVAASAMMADGIATTLFVLGPEKGTEFLKLHYPGTAALWIPDTPESPRIVATVQMAARLADPVFPVSVAR